MIRMLLNDNRYLLAVFCLLALVIPSLAFADDEEWVEVAGEAAIVDENEVHAREMALQQALRQAVEMVAGTIVTGISETSQFMSVRDEITSQGAGYIRRYEVKSSECSQGVCRTEVRALVAKQALSQRLSDLGLLVQKRGYPRVIMMIVEQNVGQEEPGAWWHSSSVRSLVVENALVSYLNRVFDEDNEECAKSPRRDECWTDLAPGMRFTFMDYRSVQAKPMVEKAQAGVDLTDEQARQLARLTDAEVAIVGRAVAVEQGAAYGVEALRSIRADLSLRMIDVDSGRILGAVNLQRTMQFVNASRGGEALMERLTMLAVPRIHRELANSWGAEEAGTRSIRLEIEGLSGFSDLTEFSNQLSHSVTGVRTVTTRSMSGSRASLDLQTTITAQQLAAELSSRALGRFNVRVTSMDSGQVGINLGK